MWFIMESPHTYSTCCVIHTYCTYNSYTEKDNFGFVTLFNNIKLQLADFEIKTPSRCLPSANKLYLCLLLSLFHSLFTCTHTHRHANNHMAIGPYVSCSIQPLPCSSGPELGDLSLFFLFFHLSVDDTNAVQGLLSADLANCCCCLYLISTVLI